MSKIHKWSKGFAYAVGLITTDGNLSKDGRHISFTSKDLEMVVKIKRALRLSCGIKKKANRTSGDKRYYYIQFSDVSLYKHFLSIGLMPNKSKVLEKIDVPMAYLPDFIRGLFDGDGYSYSYYDKRWKSSFMFYSGFVSASERHILWLRSVLKNNVKINGHITKSGNRSCFQLKYAKSESIKMFNFIYKNKGIFYLSRKYLKVRKSLAIVD